MTSDFSDVQKLAEVRRHLLMLRRTYPRAISKGHVAPHEAADALRVWEAIEGDYAERVGSSFVAA
jgi:hypothetical protein